MLLGTSLRKRVNGHDKLAHSSLTLLKFAFSCILRLKHFCGPMPYVFEPTGWHNGWKRITLFRLEALPQNLFAWLRLPSVWNIPLQFHSTRAKLKAYMFALNGIQYLLSRQPSHHYMWHGRQGISYRRTWMDLKNRRWHDGLCNNKPQSSQAFARNKRCRSQKEFG